MRSFDPAKMNLSELEAIEASIMAEIQSRYHDQEQAPQYESWRD